MIALNTVLLVRAPVPHFLLVSRGPNSQLAPRYPERRGSGGRFWQRVLAPLTNIAHRSSQAVAFALSPFSPIAIPIGYKIG
jgi:hypothetical protein